MVTPKESFNLLILGKTRKFLLNTADIDLPCKVCISKVAYHHYACVCTYTHAICFNIPVKNTKSPPAKEWL